MILVEETIQKLHDITYQDQFAGFITNLINQSTQKYNELAKENLKKSGIKSASSFIKTILMAGKFLFFAFISMFMVGALVDKENKALGISVAVAGGLAGLLSFVLVMPVNVKGAALAVVSSLILSLALSLILMLLSKAWAVKKDPRGKSSRPAHYFVSFEQVPKSKTFVLAFILSAFVVWFVALTVGGTLAWAVGWALSLTLLFFALTVFASTVAEDWAWAIALTMALSMVFAFSEAEAWDRFVAWDRAEVLAIDKANEARDRAEETRDRAEAEIQAEAEKIEAEAKAEAEAEAEAEADYWDQKVDEEDAKDNAKRFLFWGGDKEARARANDYRNNRDKARARAWTAGYEAKNRFLAEADVETRVRAKEAEARARAKEAETWARVRALAKTPRIDFARPVA
jgi:hypothetical protein